MKINVWKELLITRLIGGELQLQVFLVLDLWDLLDTFGMHFYCLHQKNFISLRCCVLVHNIHPNEPMCGVDQNSKSCPTFLLNVSNRW
jgi:hypothetical protein